MLSSIIFHSGAKLKIPVTLKFHLEIILTGERWIFNNMRCIKKSDAREWEEDDYKIGSERLARRSGAGFKNTLFVAAAWRQFNSFYATKSV